MMLDDHRDPDPISCHEAGARALPARREDTIAPEHGETSGLRQTLARFSRGYTVDLATVG